MSRSDEWVEIDELHLWLIASFVLLLGPHPHTIAGTLWLLTTAALYFITPDYLVQKGIGGRTL